MPISELRLQAIEQEQLTPSVQPPAIALRFLPKLFDCAWQKTLNFLDTIVRQLIFSGRENCFNGCLWINSRLQTSFLPDSE
jgi:hypothetical protein